LPFPPSSLEGSRGSQARSASGFVTIEGQLAAGAGAEDLRIDRGPDHALPEKARY
jgi:hypothetical protein